MQQTNISRVLFKKMNLCTNLALYLFCLFIIQQQLHYHITMSSCKTQLYILLRIGTYSVLSKSESIYKMLNKKTNPEYAGHFLSTIHK